MFKVRNRRALTLIELVIFVAVVAICVSPLLMIFSQALKAMAENEEMELALLLAKGIMEDYMGRDFYDLKPTNGTRTDYGNCGPNNGYYYWVGILPIDPTEADLGGGDSIHFGGGPNVNNSNFLRIEVLVNKDYWQGDWYSNWFKPKKRIKLVTIVTPHNY